jgi:hypothetical protein
MARYRCDVGDHVWRTVADPDWPVRDVCEVCEAERPHEVVDVRVPPATFVWSAAELERVAALARREGWASGYGVCRELALGALHPWPAIQAIVAGLLGTSVGTLVEQENPRVSPELFAALVEKSGGAITLSDVDLHRACELTLRRADDPLTGAITFRVTRRR